MKRNEKYAKYHLNNDKKFHKQVDKMQRIIKKSKKLAEAEAKKIIKVNKQNIKELYDKKAKKENDFVIYDYEEDIKYCNTGLIMAGIESKAYCKFCIYYDCEEKVCAYPGEFGCSPKAQASAIGYMIKRLEEN